MYFTCPTQIRGHNTIHELSNVRTSSTPVSLTSETCFCSWLSVCPLMPLRMQTSLLVWGAWGVVEVRERVLWGLREEEGVKSLTGGGGVCVLGRSKRED